MMTKTNENTMIKGGEVSIRTYDYILNYYKLMEIFPNKYTFEYFVSLQQDLERHETEWLNSDQRQNYIDNLNAVIAIVYQFKGGRL